MWNVSRLSQVIMFFNVRSLHTFSKKGNLTCRAGSSQHPLLKDILELMSIKDVLNSDVGVHLCMLC